MGILGKALNSISDMKEKKENKKQEKEVKRQLKRETDALDYIEREGIRCDSDIDFETIKLIVDAFEKNDEISNYSSISISESSASMENDAIETTDANMYHFCKAIIYQNFMLMRKIDTLSSRLDKIEKMTQKSKEY
jgi:hypothetical protein